MRSIVLIDHDPAYASRLASRLSHLLCMEVHGLSPGPDRPLTGDWLADRFGPDILVLAAPDVCQRLRQDPSLPPVVQLIDWLAQPPHPAAAAGQPYRLMPSSHLAAFIRETLVAAEPTRKLLASADHASGSAPGLTLALDLGWSGHRSFVRNWLRRQHEAGLEALYLPLMPVYHMSLVQNPGPGPGLTGLLLRLANHDALSPDELGPYLEFNDIGCWQFRPPEKSDDLLLADPEWLRSLVLLLRARVDARPLPGAKIETASQPAAFVDCFGLPFAYLAQLAVLSDTLAVHLPTTADWASYSARRELSELLARLPVSCRILEMPESEPSALRMGGAADAARL